MPANYFFRSKIYNYFFIPFSRFKPISKRMKTLKNCVLGVLFVCSIAACSKEEPKPCECDIAKNTSPEVPQTVDCSVPKTKKITVQAKLYIDAQGNISIDDYRKSIFDYSQGSYLQSE